VLACHFFVESAVSLRSNSPASNGRVEVHEVASDDSSSLSSFLTIQSPVSFLKIRVGRRYMVI
jgi:hypothetical protein